MIAMIEDVLILFFNLLILHDDLAAGILPLGGSFR